jgi:hypothetical protein
MVNHKIKINIDNKLSNGEKTFWIKNLAEEFSKSLSQNLFC